MIDIPHKTDKEIKAMLHPKSPVKQAKEIKLAVVSIQNAPPRVPPYFVIDAQP